MKVSLVIPVYNEKPLILKVLAKVDQVVFPSLEKEVVIVDDCSTDGTREILQGLKYSGKYQIIFHDINQGKGAAVLTGLQQCTGDIIAIQDADLEYDPHDLVKLVGLIVSGQTFIAYGSRMMGDNPKGHWAYYLGNQMISWVAQLLYGTKITDVETCYKVFHKKVLHSIDLSEKDFGFEIQFTVNALKNKFLIQELPIQYYPRQRDEGKKICWHDGVKAIWLLFKYRFRKWL